MEEAAACLVALSQYRAGSFSKVMPFLVLFMFPDVLLKLMFPDVLLKLTTSKHKASYASGFPAALRGTAWAHLTAGVHRSSC